MGRTWPDYQMGRIGGCLTIKMIDPVGHVPGQPKPDEVLACPRRPRMPGWLKPLIALKWGLSSRADRTPSVGGWMQGGVVSYHHWSNGKIFRAQEYAWLQAAEWRHRATRDRPLKENVSFCQPAGRQINHPDL